PWGSGTHGLRSSCHGRTPGELSTIAENCVCRAPERSTVFGDGATCVTCLTATRDRSVGPWGDGDGRRRHHRERIARADPPARAERARRSAGAADPRGAERLRPPLSPPGGAAAA